MKEQRIDNRDKKRVKRGKTGEGLGVGAQGGHWNTVISIKLKETHKVNVTSQGTFL